MIWLYISVQFSLSVVSDSLRPHELQHARPPCPSPTPGVHSDSRPLSQWCHPAISSSVVPSPPAPNPSQHQSLFQWVNSSHEVAKVLELYILLLLSHQLCLTLCDPIDSSPPGSPVPGILQARTLEWVAIAFSVITSATSLSYLQIPDIIKEIYTTGWESLEQT